MISYFIVILTLLKLLCGLGAAWEGPGAEIVDLLVSLRFLLLEDNFVEDAKGTMCCVTVNNII